MKKVERKSVLVSLPKGLISTIDKARISDSVTRSFFIEECIRFYLRICDAEALGEVDELLENMEMKDNGR